MKIIEFKSEIATYRVFANEVDPKASWTVFFHGGPGFNSNAEKSELGPIFHPHTNFLWFDLMGCADSPALSLDRVSWEAQTDDAFKLIRNFTRSPVNLIGHCLGAHLTHDFVRKFPDSVRSVVWYSPANEVSDIYKNVVKRSLKENRLTLTPSEKPAIEKFLNLPEEKFDAETVMQMLSLAARIDGFQELYWSNASAMQKYLGYMAQKPFVPDIYVRLQTQFFERRHRKIPAYAGIPVLAIYGNDDRVSPWELHGSRILKTVTHAKSRAIPNGFHWVHLEKTREVAQLTLEFIRNPS